jgi:hypothetical protein
MPGAFPDHLISQVSCGRKYIVFLGPCMCGDFELSQCLIPYFIAIGLIFMC